MSRTKRREGGFRRKPSNQKVGLGYHSLTFHLLPSPQKSTPHLHLNIYQSLLSRATYSKYRDIPPEASRVKCLAQGHSVILHEGESIQQPSDY